MTSPDSPSTPVEGSQPKRWWQSKFAPLLLLLVGVVLVYGQVTSFSFVNWDDTSYVYRNPQLLHPERFSLSDRWFPKRFGYPIPLTVLSYKIDQWLYQVPMAGKTNVTHGQGHHLTNLLLWLGLLTLLYQLCLSLVRSRWAAFGGVAVFAFHPTTAETVAWVTGRKELLVTLFGVASVYAMLRFFRSPTTHKMLWLILWSGLAMLSKPNAVFLVPLLLWWVVAKPKTEEASRSAKPSWGLLGAIGGFFVASSLTLVAVGALWQSKLGALETKRPLLEILDRALWALGYHIRMFWVPVQLRVKYIVGPDGFDMYHALGLLALIIALVVLLHPKTRRGIPALATALIVAAYLPSSNLLPLRRFIADTYLFLPMVGVSVLVTWALHQTGKSLQSHLRIPALLGVIVLLGGLGFLTYQQVGVWKNSATLWKHSYKFHPNSPKLCRMLGMAYNETTQNKKAAATYEHCIKKFGPRLYRNNLGITYAMMQEWDKAEAQFRAILRKNPNHRRARYFLRMIQHQKKRRVPRTRGKQRSKPKRSQKP